MRRLKIIAAKSAALLALAGVFYISTPLATPTSTGISFGPTAQGINAVDGVTMPTIAMKRPQSSSPFMILAKSITGIAANRSAGVFEGNASFPRFQIQLASISGIYKPALQAVSSLQLEPARPSLIMPNLRGSEGIGIFFLFWTALSMLYLAKRAD
jgi:hypothetical protein